MPDGRKHGPWTSFDPAAGCRLPIRVAHFLQGRRHGHEVVWRNLCKDGRCVARKEKEGPWSENHPHGLWTVYDADGQPVERGPYFRGLRHGPWLSLARDGKATLTTCNQRDKAVWTVKPGEKAPGACPTEMPDREDDGTRAVSDAEQKASRLVHNAQAAANPKLKLMYLKKAVELVPDNKNYRALLDAALAAQSDNKP